jgi:hypothetical protein
MGPGIQTHQTAAPPDFPTGDGQNSNPHPSPAPQGGKVLELGKAFIRTLRHFWPKFNGWVDDLPDSRFQEMITYDKHFLVWWGLLLFLLKLGSRRQLDFQLRDVDLKVLANLNQLAGTDQDSLPVHKTLDHFLGHVGSSAFAGLRTQCIRQLIRNKVLDDIRLDGEFVVATDGTGFLTFSERHCPHCLVQKQATKTIYFHPVLEAKIVHQNGMALSVGTEFIENPLPQKPSQDPSADLKAYETVKQDCELKAFLRLAPQLKKAFPQTPFCIGGDSLLACGPVIQVCRQMDWSFVLTFKPGRTPSLWEDFQGALKLSPENRLKVQLPDGTRQVFRWVNDLIHIDSENRTHLVHALLCEETAQGVTKTYSWITNKRLSPGNVAKIATHGGRVRFKIENQGFNIQKNSGLNLEHAYSIGEDTMKSFYYLLQIAHLFMQMFEMGSLLRNLARGHGSTPVGLFGSLKNIAQRLLECFRYCELNSEVFNPSTPFQIRLGDTS